MIQKFVSVDTQAQKRTAELSQNYSDLKAEITKLVQAEKERERVIAELQKSLAKIKRLEVILPICSFCKKIRDENDRWQSIETYISDHFQVKFSHGFCPKCSRKHYPEYFSNPTEE